MKLTASGLLNWSLRTPAHCYMLLGLDAPHPSHAGGEPMAAGESSAASCGWIRPKLGPMNGW
jgi:hypothetical protein